MRFADIAAPAMTLLGPELVRDLDPLVQRAEADDAIQVLVFRTATPDCFIAHVGALGWAERADGRPNRGMLPR